MRRSGRYCLYNTLRVVNVVVNIFGMIIIIYSLWLLKKWFDGVSDLPSPSNLPRPWFINVCLGVGIAVCLSTLSGHMVANCISKSILGVYIVSIFSLLVIQAAVVVVILFRIDWDSQIFRYIDDDHKGFRSFLLFHIVVCRLIGIVVLVAQIKIVVLAAILWAVGGELILDSNIPAPIDIKQSFLADHNSPVIDAQRWREEILKHYMDGIFTKSFCQLRRNQS
ncbi:tetraspanin-18-like isoform X1 [Rhododendron vialii]|uniref:tetraspanin-18-like isoform X1 n=1 Tax=Rhododendron vialii TaxID=182163 RepID=UPI00265E67CE|nr:tetraspanin-18-like isoform X1 [Rhododendron vialii]